MVVGTRKAANQTTFAAELLAASGHPLTGDLKWVVRDWDGNPLAEGDRRVTVPAGGERLAVEVPAGPFPERLKFAEAEFSLAIPGQVVPKVQAYWLAPHTPHDDPALRPESPFGMGVYLNRFRGADQEAVAQAARDAGVKWSREDFGWGHIEREPGNSTGRFTTGSSTWPGPTALRSTRSSPISRAGRKGTPAKALTSTRPLLRQLVQRYRDRIKQWEIWNEPNIFFWQGPKELYAECLIKSYQAIKETDPTAEVLGISTGWHRLQVY